MDVVGLTVLIMGGFVLGVAVVGYGFQKCKENAGNYLETFLKG